MAVSCGQARTAFVAPNDQPWSQPFRFWLDQARTQPLMLTDAGGWLQYPGGSSKVTLEASAVANVATLSMAQGDLAALRFGTWWGELQFEIGGDTVTSLRFDLEVRQGFGTGLSATKGVAPVQDVVVCSAGPVDVVMLAIGVGGAAQTMVGPAVQQRLNVTNVDDAISRILDMLAGGDGSLDFKDPADSGLIGH